MRISDGSSDVCSSDLPAERVYRAFLDPGALVKWLPPHGFTGTVHHMDARVGGGYKMSFTNFGTGHSHSFSATYVELKPGERIRHTAERKRTRLNSSH